MKKLGRILGAAVLAVIASMFVNACTLLLFGGTAYTIRNFKFQPDTGNIVIDEPDKGDYHFHFE